jgi:hypothetical protein
MNKKKTKINSNYEFRRKKNFLIGMCMLVNSYTCLIENSVTMFLFPPAHYSTVATFKISPFNLLFQWLLCIYHDSTWWNQLCKLLLKYEAENISRYWSTGTISFRKLTWYIINTELDLITWFKAILMKMCSGYITEMWVIEQSDQIKHADIYMTM